MNASSLKEIGILCQNQGTTCSSTLIFAALAGIKGRLYDKLTIYICSQLGKLGVCNRRVRGSAVSQCSTDKMMYVVLSQSGRCAPRRRIMYVN